MLHPFVWANIIANRYHTLRWRVRASTSHTLPVPRASPKSLKLGSASTSDRCQCSYNLCLLMSTYVVE
jgi:hypothetical protein